jgi:hypothetical protein
MSYNELLQIAESRHIAKINHKHKIEKFLARLMEGGIPEPDSITGDLGGQIYVCWEAPNQIRIFFDERGDKILFGVLALRYSEDMPEHLKVIQRSPIINVNYDDVDTVKNMMQEVFAYVL